MKKQLYKKKFRHPGIFFKIFLFFELLMIVAIVVTSSYIIKRFSGKMLEKEITIGDMNLEKLADFGRDKYNRIYSLYNYIHSGEVSRIIVDSVKSPENAYDINNIQKVNAFFSGVLSADSDISDVILVSKSNVVFTRTEDGYSDIRPSFDFFSYEKVKNFIDSEESLKIIYDVPSSYTLKEREPVVSFLGKIYDPGLFPKKNLAGFFIMNVPLKKISQKDFVSEVSGEGELMLLNKEGQILFSSLDEKQCGNQFKENSNQNEFYINIKDVGTSGMKALYTLPNHALLNEVIQINQKIYKVMVIAILLTICMYLIIYRIINKRVQILIESMEQLQKGRFDLKIPVKSEDEIGIISKAFNEMCEKLNVYVAQVYAAEIQRKNAELNALQTQIDPHFLYNTLDSIRTKALTENAEDTAEMIVLLGDLFRWNSRTKDKFILLEMELEYIETYLKLQKYRYDDQLEVEFKVEDECLDDFVPKLILQPLVENVIKHAFVKRTGKGIIGIRVKEKENIRLEITVFDNGIGIKEDKLYEMNEQLRQPTGQDEFNSIGLQNVQARIRLLYGDQYGVQVNSIDGMGTAVKVILPVLKEKGV